MSMANRQLGKTRRQPSLSTAAQQHSRVCPNCSPGDSVKHSRTHQTKRLLPSDPRHRRKFSSQASTEDFMNHNYGRQNDESRRGRQESQSWQDDRGGDRDLESSQGQRWRDGDNDDQSGQRRSSGRGMSGNGRSEDRWSGSRSDSQTGGRGSGGDYDRYARGGDSGGQRYDDRDYGRGFRSDSDRSEGFGFGSGRASYGQSSSQRESGWAPGQSGYGDMGGGGMQGRGHVGKGPKDYQRSDERIREDISERMTDDERLDASEIVVQVSKAEVTLSGTVSDREQKRQAEDMAELVKGVKNITNNIKVQRQGQADGAQSATEQTGNASAGSTGAAASTGGAGGSSGGASGKGQGRGAATDH
jgi:osmotically-inducible protein OsmY